MSRSARGFASALLSILLALTVPTIEPASAAPGDYLWTSLGGIITSAPDIGELEDGSAYFVARGADGALWVHLLGPEDQIGEGSWFSLGGQIVGSPTISNTIAQEPEPGTGRLDVFARGRDDGLWTRSFNATDGVWTPWESLGGVLTSEPSAVAFGDPDNELPGSDLRIAVFGRGTDNSLWQREFVGGSGWTDWSSLGGILTSGPGAGGYPEFPDGVVAVRGTDGAAWYKYYEPETGAFSPWFYGGGTLSSAPSSEFFCTPALWGRGTDNSIWQAYTDPHTGWISYGGVNRSAAGTHDVYFFNFWLMGVRGADHALWFTGDDIVFDEDHCGSVSAADARRSGRPAPAWLDGLR